ncbi:1458_t:CDS:2 [Entrophospora sp. SA101]|nr:1458_t:CDS:2 [Entrophospora sp. SA101]
MKCTSDKGTDIHINHLLKECKYVSDEKCKSLTIYDRLQIGLELNFYSMDWSGNGIYRFGLIDQCRLPSGEDECGMLEDSKSLVTKKLVKSLFLENTKGKRCQITSETEAELNINHSPQKLKLN